MTKAELEQEVKKLEKKNRELFIKLTDARLDIEEMEDNATDYMVANEIFYGQETRRMLRRFVEDEYGLKNINKIRG